MTTKAPAFAHEVWTKLSAINVNQHTEKKVNLTYLSWAWAWGVLMEHYPESEYEIHPEITLDNGSVECRISLTIKSEAHTLTRMMWLPVMNHKNQAISNPDAVAINKTRMRCLAKCIAMFGLGHYIYAGEDIPHQDAPEPEPISAEQQQALETFAQANPKRATAMLAHYGVNTIAELSTASASHALNAISKSAQQAQADNDEIPA